MGRNGTIQISFGLGMPIFLIFLTLKILSISGAIGGNFTWLTWFWVFFPLWIGFAIILGILLFIAIIKVIAS